MILDNLLGLTFEIEGLSLEYGLFYLAIALIHFLPGLALAIRRLHDVGKSGWFLLIALVPIIGAVWLFILICSEGDRAENTYGPDPKGEYKLDYLK